MATGQEFIDAVAARKGAQPSNITADVRGVTLTFPDGSTVRAERKRIKACANANELAAYVEEVAR